MVDGDATASAALASGECGAGAAGDSGGAGACAAGASDAPDAADACAAGAPDSAAAVGAATTAAAAATASATAAPAAHKTDTGDEMRDCIAHTSRQTRSCLRLNNTPSFRENIKKQGIRIGVHMYTMYGPGETEINTYCVMVWFRTQQPLLIIAATAVCCM